MYKLGIVRTCMGALTIMPTLEVSVMDDLMTALNEACEKLDAICKDFTARSKPKTTKPGAKGKSKK